MSFKKQFNVQLHLRSLLLLQPYTKSPRQSQKRQLFSIPRVERDESPNRRFARTVPAHQSSIFLADVVANFQIHLIFLAPAAALKWWKSQCSQPKVQQPFVDVHLMCNQLTKRATKIA